MPKLDEKHAELAKMLTAITSDSTLSSENKTRAKYQKIFLLMIYIALWLAIHLIGIIIYNHEEKLQSKARKIQREICKVIQVIEVIVLVIDYEMIWGCFVAVLLVQCFVLLISLYVFKAAAKLYNNSLWYFYLSMDECTKQLLHSKLCTITSMFCADFRFIVLVKVSTGHSRILQDTIEWAWFSNMQNLQTHAVSSSL